MMFSIMFCFVLFMREETLEISRNKILLVSFMFHLFLFSNLLKCTLIHGLYNIVPERVKEREGERVKENCTIVTRPARPPFIKIY